MDQLNEVEVVSQEAEQFYTEIRGLVVVFLLFAFFFTLAHLILQYFLSKSESESKSSRADKIAYQIVLGICTFTLTIGFIACSLLPFSIVANEILVLFPHSYYIQWLNTDLVQDLALVINLGTKISCILLPLSYFLLISQGFHDNSNALSSRILEALFTLLFTYILIFGTTWSLCNFISALYNLIFGSSQLLVESHFSVHPIDFIQDLLHTHGWTSFLYYIFFQTIMRSVEFIQVATSLCGLCLLFICAPLGFLTIGLRLITRSLQSLPDISSISIVNDRIERLNIEALTYLDDIQTVMLLNPRELSIHLLSNTNFQIPLAINGRFNCIEFISHRSSQLDLLRLELLKLKRRSSRSIYTLIRECLIPSLYGICIFLLILLLRLTEVYVSFNILTLLWNMILGMFEDTKFSSVSWTGHAFNQLDSNFTLGLKPVSSLGHFGAAFQVSVIHFLLWISLWGFYSIPNARFVHPKPHRTNIEVIIFNISLFLILSMALPLQTNLLGLTTLTLPSSLRTNAGQLISCSSACPNSKCDVVSCPADQKFIQPNSLQAHLKYNIDQTRPKTSETSSSNGFSFWLTFFPLDSHSHYFDLKSYSSPVVLESTLKPSSLKTSTYIHSVQALHASQPSIWSQFVARAFGCSNVSPSYSLAFIILIYNLGFLFTSVWIAGRRLGHAALSFRLEVLTSFKCLQQLYLMDRTDHGPSSLNRHSLLIDRLPCETTAVKIN